MHCTFAVFFQEYKECKHFLCKKTRQTKDLTIYSSGLQLGFFMCNSLIPEFLNTVKYIKVKKCEIKKNSLDLFLT